jgi:tetratricopeptide (TPR) repeat protein
MRRAAPRCFARVRARAASIALALGWVAGVALCPAAPAASAQEPAGALLVAADTSLTPAELAKMRRGLASPQAETRRQAFLSLSSLGQDALPSLTGRLQKLASQGFERAALLEAMSELRRLQGVTAPDGDVDLAKGVLPLLSRDRTEAALLAAELVALLRALEAQKSLAAAELILGKLFALDSKLFRYEAPRTRARFGVLMLPALIRHQNHPRPWLRDFCRESLVAMRADSPGRAVQHDDVALLSAILLAYGDTLAFEAMPVVVSYVTDERSEVQSAARKAVARFGRNAIWQLRERYLNTTGKEADPSWSHQRLLTELSRWFEAPKREAVDSQLATAQRALAGGDFAAGEKALDLALQVAPFGELPARAAPLYVRIAGHHEANDQLERALACLRRAVRLSPTDTAQSTWLSRISYLEGELRLGKGQVDLTAYQRALALDPGLAEARAVLDELTGVNAERERTRRRAFTMFAAVLLCAAGYFSLRSNRRALLAREARRVDVGGPARAQSPEEQASDSCSES